MDDLNDIPLPDSVPAIEADTRRLQFPMASDTQTGALLRTLAATMPNGRFLELGTGTGLGTAWLLDGMDRESRLITADNDHACLAVAKHHLGSDARVEFREQDGSALLDALAGTSFDLIFADTWPGKFWDMEKAVDLLKPGGIYIVDDLLPQPSWPDGHAEKVPPLLEKLQNHPDLVSCRMVWSTGLLIATRKA